MTTVQPSAPFPSGAQWSTGIGRWSSWARREAKRHADSAAPGKHRQPRSRWNSSLHVPWKSELNINQLVTNFTNKRKNIISCPGGNERTYMMRVKNKKRGTQVQDLSAPFLFFINDLLNMRNASDIVIYKSSIRVLIDYPLKRQNNCNYRSSEWRIFHTHSNCGTNW